FISTDQLSRAGFYYTGIGDIVRCFACHGILYNWEVGDDPIMEHKKHFKHCKFIAKIENYDDVSDSSSSHATFGRDVTGVYKWQCEETIPLLADYD
ncbi:inhibitor of apoptosis protein 2-like protein, partial [Leptotrombidium deliense]